MPYHTHNRYLQHLVNDLDLSEIIVSRILNFHKKAASSENPLLNTAVTNCQIGMNSSFRESVTFAYEKLDMDDFKNFACNRAEIQDIVLGWHYRKLSPLSDAEKSEVDLIKCLLDEREFRLGNIVSDKADEMLQYLCVC